jgi:hypothetical protein
MTPSIWSAALHYAREAVICDLRSKGERWQRYTHAELVRMAHARLIEEAKEWLKRQDE